MLIIKCFKNKIDHFHNTLDKFSKGRDNLDLLLGRTSYNNVGLGYEPKKLKFLATPALKIRPLNAILLSVIFAIKMSTSLLLLC